MSLYDRETVMNVLDMSNKNKWPIKWKSKRDVEVSVKALNLPLLACEWKEPRKTASPGAGTDKGMAVAWSLQEEKQPANTTIAGGCVSDFWLQK